MLLADLYHDSQHVYLRDSRFRLLRSSLCFGVLGYLVRCLWRCSTKYGENIFRLRDDRNSEFFQEPSTPVFLIFVLKPGLLCPDRLNFGRTARFHFDHKLLQSIETPDTPD
jgi:hypothetical protein